MPMSNSEEALDDFPIENPISTAEFMVGAYRAESTDLWTAVSGITSKKIHHVMMVQLPGSSMGSSLMIGWILQCLKKVNEDQH